MKRGNGREQREEVKPNSVRGTKEMLDEMCAWGKALPQATLDEVAGNLAHLRRELLGESLRKFLLQQGDGSYKAEICPERGQKTKSNGRRTALHAEKEAKAKRTHRLCPDCRPGTPPPGPPPSAVRAR